MDAIPLNSTADEVGKKSHYPIRHVIPYASLLPANNNFSVETIELRPGVIFRSGFGICTMAILEFATTSTWTALIRLNVREV